MAEEILYLKAEKNIEVTKDEVLLKDAVKVFCEDPHILDRVKSIRLHEFRKGESRRQVFSVLRLIQLITKNCPGVKVVNLGEPDLLLERVEPDQAGGWKDVWKISFVALISFFGTAFTIMAFHNDIGISEVFRKVYEMIMGRPAPGYSILELTYSLGLAVGIIVFFNHIGGRRITKDPTPIEVEMRIYEREVNDALIETSDREGMTINVS